MKSSPPQQVAVVEAWTADLLVFGQALYHWAILPVFAGSMAIAAPKPIEDFQVLHYRSVFIASIG